MNKKSFLMYFIPLILFVLFIALSNNSSGSNCGGVGGIACTCGDTVGANFTMTGDLQLGLLAVVCLTVQNSSSANQLIVFDCAGYSLIGNNSGSGAAFSIIHNNTIVRNCNVTGFNGAFGTSVGANVYNLTVVNNSFNLNNSAPSAGVYPNVLSDSSLNTRFFNFNFTNNTVKANEFIELRAPQNSFITRNVVFARNGTANFPGAIKLVGGSGIKIEFNEFRNFAIEPNQGSLGWPAGALVLNGVNPGINLTNLSITNNTFINNTVGIAFFGLLGAATITNATVTNNSIVNNSFINNTFDIIVNATYGQSNVTIQNNLFTSNRLVTNDSLKVIDNSTNNWNDSSTGNYWEFLSTAFNCWMYNPNGFCANNGASVAILNEAGVITGRDSRPGANFSLVNPVSKFNGTGSTNTSLIADVTNVSGFNLSTSLGAIKWLNTVNIFGINLDQFVNFSSKFMSVDTANLNTSLNGSAQLSISGVTCPVDIYFKQGVSTSNADITSNGVKCTSSTDPACTNIACSGGTVSFNVTHFTSYGTTTQSSASTATTTATTSSAGGGGTAPIINLQDDTATSRFILSKEFIPNAKIIIKINGKERELTADFIREKTTSFTFAGNKFKLSEGEKTLLDIDEDGYSDLKITLLKIFDENKAKIEFELTYGQLIQQNETQINPPASETKNELTKQEEEPAKEASEQYTFTAIPAKTQEQQEQTKSEELPKTDYKNIIILSTIFILIISISLYLILRHR